MDFDAIIRDLICMCSLLTDSFAISPRIPTRFFPSLLQANDDDLPTDDLCRAWMHLSYSLCRLGDLSRHIDSGGHEGL